MVPNKQTHIIAGGTISPIAPHLSLAAEAYGMVGRSLKTLCEELMPKMETTLHQTLMAGGRITHDRFPGALETNADIEARLEKLVADPATKVIILAAALCDFEPVGGYREERFKTDNGNILH